MNKKLLMMAGVLTAFVLVALGGVFASAMSQANPLEKLGMSKLSDKVYQTLGLKTPAQMNQSLTAQVVKNTESNLDSATDSQKSVEVAKVTAKPEMAQTMTNTPAKTDFWGTVAKPYNPQPAQVAQTIQHNNGVDISEQQARSIAQRAAPNVQFGSPELVRYSGKVAYEVVSREGNVYIDAQTGAILDNGAAPAAQPRGYKGEDDEDEHHSKKRRHHDEDDDEEDEDHRG